MISEASRNVKRLGENPLLNVGEIFLPEVDLRHGERLAPQIAEDSRVCGQRERELVGVKGLAGLAIAAVHIAPAVLAVSQQRATQMGHGHADLMGASGEQAALHQGERSPGLQGLVEGDGGLAAGNGPGVEVDLLFDLIFK